MLRNITFIIIALVIITSCVPLEYIEPSVSEVGPTPRAEGVRNFYFTGADEPIRLEYNNGTARGQLYYQIDDPYVDVYMAKGGKNSGVSNGYSKETVSLCFDYYIKAQKAIIDDNYQFANEQIDQAIELIELQEFFDLKGSIYYLAGDTASANYYWNYLKN